MKRGMSVFVLCCFLLCPIWVMAETVGQQEIIIQSDDFVQIIEAGQSFFVMDSNGAIYPYLYEQGALSDAVATIDREASYPVVINDQLWIYMKDDEVLRCVWPGEGQTALPVPMDRRLTGGGETWSLASLHEMNNAVYFLYYDGGSDTPTLCKYDFSAQSMSWETIEGLMDYTLDDSETYAMIQTSSKTIVQRVDWQGNNDQELFRLSGHLTAFAVNDGKFYAVDENDFVIIEDGKITLRVHSPYATGAWDGMVTHDTYWVLGTFGLYSPNFADEQTAVRTLKILSSGADDIDRAFMLQYPDVVLEYVPSTAYEGTDLAEAIVSGLIEFDVGHLGNTDAAADALMAKGYTYDLSASAPLLAKAQTMYEPIRDFIFDGDRLLFIPTNIQVVGLTTYNEENLLLAGITAEQMPRTLDELFDLMIVWYEEYEISDDEEDIVPMLFESPHADLLNMVLNAYIAHCRRNGESLDFNTPSFRALLDKAKMIADMSPVQTEYYQPQQLFRQTGITPVPKTNTIVFPISEDESPLYEGRINGYMVYAGTEVPDLALTYVEWRMDHLSQRDQMLLYEGDYQAIEREDFADRMAQWLAEREQLEAALLEESSPAEQKDIQTQIDRLTQNIEHPSDGLRYDITNDEIAYYQDEIIPNIEFAFSNQITESSNRGSWAKTLIGQYLAGQIGQDEFISQLNQRVWMMLMEE